MSAENKDETKSAAAESAREDKMLLILFILGVGWFVWWFFFTEDASESAPRQPDTMSQAKTACVDALRVQSTYPSSFDVSYFSNPPQTIDKGKGEILVKVPFTAKNGLGNEIPLMGLCVVQNGAVVNVLTNNR